MVAPKPAELAHERLFFGVDPLVAFKVGLGAERFEALVAVEFWLFVHGGDVMRESALIDE
jgi:hypothetical protein